ncbi:hypothetical protein HG535_0C02130 [Zygotorulaspora mrakii]|uniref:Thioredoxin domain-containing protein n=1 Tax=Zygotorulaspora mrakii TaxID=42260 RepID=A0A7H9B045_ZYGMR|nr:uncharacterized protein HG535_0C02130 [Zygotorulaspora mrakii]QLG71863.1 hypothetical protein HG535_0C02130 [Zygotorulaspora mrakii]
MLRIAGARSIRGGFSRSVYSCLNAIKTESHLEIRSASWNRIRLLSNGARLCDEKGSINTGKELSDVVEKKKKKPLSRIPIGGSVDASSQKLTGNSIEFATWKAAVLIIAVGGGLYYFFSREKKRLETMREAEANRGYGRPVVGGPFKLIDFNGNEFTEKNLLGKFSILYFGFTHCPDICPDELDKLGIWLEDLKQKHGISLQPVFITCDPARDSPAVLKKYLEDFHPDIIGLTGTYDEVKSACKQYRVYFSTPPSVKPGQDYLVDHSIFFYLMDPEGNFVEALGRNYDEKTGVDKILDYCKSYTPKEEREKMNEKWYSFLLK